MERELLGRVALVTGGGSGIGREACLAFARAGAAVAVADRNLAAAEETAAAVGPLNSRAIAISANVTREDDVKRMIEFTVSKLGALDCAFNNAGVGHLEINSKGKRLTDIDLPAWNTIISTNLTGVWLCMKAELLIMLAAGRGTIVNNASIAGLIGYAKASAPYNASKHGVVGLTRAAALEYAADNIRINAVCPGPVRTPLNVPSIDVSRLAKSIPMNRFAQPSEIAEMVVWLCTDRASYITGMAYAVDGGVTCGQSL